MRVLQLITQARGGPVDHAVDVAVELAQRGHDSHLVGPVGPYAAAAVAAGVAVHHADVRSKTDVVGGRAVSRIVADVRPDVVHLQDRRAGLVGRVLALRSGVPTVYTLHGVPDPLAPLVPGNAVITPARRRDRIDNLVLERVLARTPRSVVVTPCEALARYARVHVGVPAHRVHTVHNGVGRPWLEGPDAAEQSSGAAVNAVWLGVMQPVKRVPALVRAAATVPDLRLQLVGDGPERARIEAAVEVSGAADRVSFAGFQQEPAPFLRSADLVVLPSAAEACPMALLQAMACAVPVIASRAGGIPEIVRDRVDGLLVDTGSEDQLAAALAELTADASLRHRLGRSARARVLGQFTVEHCVQRLLDVYEGVIR
ncbi:MULTISPECIES: glycosyltransferase family 4 protein [Nocardioides]|uniref:Glycosyltransferase family 4 protein n=1 Tax=Nocardioides vastitatis TaxID=2568655 RepID=A0ABW0ZDY3_9ACTN|nr:glycosyltransferase family 4 protein [Nocardioides sp.]THI98870.1 glycosyltransferase family 4 protein [Nocardioides sp.]